MVARLKARGLPAARLAFTTDHGLLRAVLPAMHWHMLRHHGIVGLYLPRIAPHVGLRSMRRADRGPSIIVKGNVDDTDINLLYSELQYLQPCGSDTMGLAHGPSVAVAAHRVFPT